MCITGIFMSKYRICKKKEAELVLNSRDLSSVLGHDVYNMYIKHKHYKNRNVYVCEHKKREKELESVCMSSY